MPSFSVIGPGHVGATLAVALTRKGYNLKHVYSRSRLCAENIVKMVGAGRAMTDYSQALETDILLLTVPDSAIKSVSNALFHATANQNHKLGTIVCHCSGALPSTIMEVLTNRGCLIGSAHPLQSFADILSTIRSLSGTRWAIEGNKHAVTELIAMVKRLEGIPLQIITEKKAHYHAAAVMACNNLVSLLSLSTRLFANSGVSHEEALQALIPLVKGTVENVNRLGLALTGPVSRGDITTIHRHLSCLSSLEDADKVYRLLSKEASYIAEQQPNGITTDIGNSLRNILQKPIEG